MADAAWELIEDSSSIHIISPNEDWVLNGDASLKEEMMQDCNNKRNLIGEPSIAGSPPLWLNGT